MTEPEPWYVKLAAIAAADVDRIQAGRATSPDHSPILLLPRSDPAVRRFLDAATTSTGAPGLPAVWLGYVPQAAVEALDPSS